MRKIHLAAAMALAISLGGCAGLTEFFNKVQTTVSLVTKSYANPVTKNDLFEVETGIDTAAKLLQGYKSACAKGAVDTNCRANVAAIQVYTTQMPPLLTQLRDLVKNNDQINAVTVYNQFVALIVNFKTAARNAGINVGA